MMETTLRVLVCARSSISFTVPNSARGCPLSAGAGTANDCGCVCGCTEEGSPNAAKGAGADTMPPFSAVAM
jgi:hypothetical protein